jgi:hypothetical protein
MILAPSMSRRSPFASGLFLRKERRQGFIRGAGINRGCRAFSAAGGGRRGASVANGGAEADT